MFKIIKSAAAIAALLGVAATGAKQMTKNSATQPSSRRRFLAGFLLPACAVMVVAATATVATVEPAAASYSQGYEDGQRAGRRDGLSDGYRRAYRASYRDGRRDGQEDFSGRGNRSAQSSRSGRSNWASYYRGFRAGYADGYERGYRIGVRRGDRDGYSDGYRRVANEGLSRRERMRRLMERCIRNGTC